MPVWEVDTHTESRAAASSYGVPGTEMSGVTLQARGSMRPTTLNGPPVPHTIPLATLMSAKPHRPRTRAIIAADGIHRAVALPVTRTRSITFPVVGSSRTISSAPLCATHTCPSPAATDSTSPAFPTNDGESGVTPAIRFVRALRRVTVLMLSLGNQTVWSAKAAIATFGWTLMVD